MKKRRLLRYDAEIEYFKASASKNEMHKFGKRSNAPPLCFIVLYKTCKVTLEISGTAGECQVNSVSVTVDAG